MCLAAIFLTGLIWVYVLMSPKLAEPLYYPALFRPAVFPSGNWQRTEVSGIERQECFFKNKNGAELSGWLFSQPNSSRTILLSHGNGGNVTSYLDLVELLLSTGASVFIYDYEGYGKSTGHPSLSGICRDGVSAYDYLHKQRGVAKEQIIAYGQSLGTGVACFIARQRQCAGIVLQSGYASLARIGDEMCPLFSLYPGWLQFNQRLDNLAYLQRPHPPLLLLHGMKDAVIPASHSEDLYKYSLGPKTFTCLPHADHDHGWNTDAKIFTTALHNFLTELSSHAQKDHTPSNES
jgi:fermentation-respiration switch protein FrsA (DUF1100 family)